IERRIVETEPDLLLQPGQPQRLQRLARRRRMGRPDVLQSRFAGHRTLLIKDKVRKNRPPAVPATGGRRVQHALEEGTSWSWTGFLSRTSHTASGSLVCPSSWKQNAPEAVSNFRIFSSVSRKVSRVILAPEACAASMTLVTTVAKL